MLNYVKICLSVGFIFTHTFLADSTTSSVDSEVTSPFIYSNEQLVDSLMSTMSLDEKIGQLFMVAAYSNKGEEHIKEIEELIEKHHIGGLIFFQGGPSRELILTRRYQQLSKIPLMISIDGEWGLAMRLDSTIKYPYQMTLGAVQDNKLIYQMGRDIAEQCRQMGIHVNLAPVIDVNNNPKNPVINVRSFGESPFSVAEKGEAYMRGLQDGRVMANAKHFPGHGDTDKDSHKTLPVIQHNKSRLDSIELYPFDYLFKRGLGSVMVAHLNIPSIMNPDHIATTLAPEVVQGLLKDSMGFKGLVFTDALNMKGVSSYYKPGLVDLKALLAGNDVLLFSEDVGLAVKHIKKAIREGKITEEEIHQRCKKIIQAKYWLRVSKDVPVLSDSVLYKSLHQSSYYATYNKLVESSLTLLKNENKILPLRSLNKVKIACLSVGADSSDHFLTYLQRYKKMDAFSIDENYTEEKMMHLMDTLPNYDVVIVAIHKSDETPWKPYKISPRLKLMLSKLAERVNVVLDVFANPYSLIDFPLKNMKAVLLSYQNGDRFQDFSAQLLFGGIPAVGKLPVSISEDYPIGSGIITKKIRLKYSIPEDVGLKSSDLMEIDSIVYEGIIKKAYPGAQLSIAKGGVVIFDKTYGNHTYENIQPVEKTDIYDMASVTKIAATLLAVMDLQQKGLLDIDKTLGDYLPEYMDTSKYGEVNIREMLAHQAGLPAWIPFYLKTVHETRPRYEYYSDIPTPFHTVKVAEKLYLKQEYLDTIMLRILSTPLDTSQGYKYSDIGYYFLKEIVEKVTKRSIQNYLEDNFYSPMGMNSTGFLPLEWMSKENVVPTEKDSYYRNQLLQGYVHDMGAAMLGGVGGHAGLFSNATDMTKLMQMYLDFGVYGGDRYIKDSVLADFTKCQYCEKDNRRGAGFDKPSINDDGGATCSCVSQRSFGHSGFTGTYAWADPDKEVVYVFISNRVYPDMNNKKLISLGIRTRIQEVIYDAIAKSESIPTVLNDSLGRGSR